MENPGQRDVTLVQISGFDRADGIDDRPGTATPSDALLISSAGNGTTPAGEDQTLDSIPFEENPDSPEIERAEQATLTHRFILPWNEALTRIQSLGRGTVLFDSYGNATKVLSAKIQRQKPGYATLHVVEEGLSFDSPPDQFRIEPVELGINIMKHPRYFYAFLGNGYGSTEEKDNQMVIRLLQDYMENTTAAFRDALTKMIEDSIGHPKGAAQDGVSTTPPPVGGTVAPNSNVQPPEYDPATRAYKGRALVAGTDMAKRAALEIIQKYWRGEETPYIVGYQITWTVFYFRPPSLNPGGYVEDPMRQATPQLPEYFYSTNWPPNTTDTIFDYITTYNPQCYSSTGKRGGPLLISWLRKADVMEEQRTWFKVDRTWIGSPVGFWDTELYSGGERPHYPSNYKPTQRLIDQMAARYT
jgi:hypothetical protein